MDNLDIDIEMKVVVVGPTGMYIFIKLCYKLQISYQLFYTL